MLTADLLTDVYEHPVDVLPHPVTGALLVLPRHGAGTRCHPVARRGPRMNATRRPSVSLSTPA